MTRIRVLCSCDIATSSALLWEGIMGSRQPAVLLRETVNVERCGEERRERLSTGRYTLVDISCRGCYKKLGWHYLCAVTPVGLSIHSQQCICDRSVYACKYQQQGCAL